MLAAGRRRKNPAAVALGRRGGSVRSEAKAAAARANGARGGRPAKTTIEQAADESATRRRASEKR